MSRTFFRTQPYRASESGARRMHGYVEYASEESRGAQLTEERDTDLLTWKDERGRWPTPTGGLRSAREKGTTTPLSCPPSRGQRLRVDPGGVGRVDPGEPGKHLWHLRLHRPR